MRGFERRDRGWGAGVRRRPTATTRPCGFGSAAFPVNGAARFESRATGDGRDYRLKGIGLAHGERAG